MRISDWSSDVCSSDLYLETMPSIRGRSLSNPTPPSADDLHDRPGGGRTVLPAGLVRPKRRCTGAESENALGPRGRAGAGRRSEPATPAEVQVIGREEGRERVWQTG